MMLPHGFFLQQHNLVFFHRGSGIPEQGWTPAYQQGYWSPGDTHRADGHLPGRKCIVSVSCENSPTCHIWGHTKCVWVLKTHLWGHRWARIRVSLLCGKRSALSGLCHYKRLHSQLVLCREHGCVCNLPQTMLAMQTGRCLSRGRRGNDSASFFLLSPVVDFPGFLQAGPN